MAPSAQELAQGPTCPLPMSAGRVVGGKYELVSLIGRGSMGEVWVARHRSLDEKVALKLLTRPVRVEDGPGEDPRTAAARFQFEAQVAARLARGTKHIVRVSDHGEEGSLAYLVMELLDGQTLESTLLHYGAMPPFRVAAVVRQAARGLAHAHAQGVVHRDLKPANLFLTRDESGASTVKLLDFGIARAFDSSKGSPPSSAFVTAANSILGTPGYMSPEHASGDTAPDHHCDLWGLATIAYEALTGDLPVAGVEPYELLANLQARAFVPVHDRIAELPPGLAAFFERAFAEKVADRFQSAEELARAFDKVAGDVRVSDRPAASVMATKGAPTIKIRRKGAAAAPTPSPGPAAAEAPSSEPGRDRRVWTAAAIFLLVAAGLGVAAWELRPRATPPSPEPPAAAVAPAPPPEPRAASSEAAPAPPAVPARGAEAPVRPAARENPCDTPYTYDQNGTKRWKRECL